MDYRDYSALYQQLLSERGRAELGDDPNRQNDVVERINAFLKTYPSVVPPDKRPNATIMEISLAELYKRTIQTAIEIVHDISGIVTEQDTLSRAEFRRRLFRTFTTPERRLYVGVWLIFLSFLLYFIDSAA